MFLLEEGSMLACVFGCSVCGENKEVFLDLSYILTNNKRIRISDMNERIIHN